jgi:hypothetical protein
VKLPRRKFLHLAAGAAALPCRSAPSISGAFFRHLHFSRPARNLCIQLPCGGPEILHFGARNAAKNWARRDGNGCKFILRSPPGRPAEGSATVLGYEWQQTAGVALRGCAHVDRRAGHRSPRAAGLPLRHDL